LVFGNIPNIFCSIVHGVSLITIREMWGLESRSRTSKYRSPLLW